MPTKKESLLQEWKDAITLGIRYRTVYGRSAEWGIYKNMYRGYWGGKIVPVNILYAVARSLIPQLYFRNPRVEVLPRRPGFGPHAQVLTKTDNYLMNETNVKRECKRLILDAYICGVGCGIHGYDSEFGYSPSFQLDNYFEFSDTSNTQEDDKGNRLEYNDNIKPGMPWFVRSNPLDFVVPWGTTYWEDARWFAFRKMRPLRDIMEDPKYTNKTDLAGPYRSVADRPHEGQQSTKINIIGEDSKEEYVELYEIHDKRTKRVYTISLDHPKFLRNEFDYLQVEGMPAQVLQFNEDPDYFWCAPDARHIRVQQDELNDIRTMARAHRRVALLKVIADKNISSEELEKFIDGNPSTMMRVDVGPTGDIRKLIHLVQAHVPPDLTIAAREVREDIREIIGFSRNQMGAFEAPSGRRTAYETEVVRAASMIRVDERRDEMAELLTRVVRTYNQIIFENWNEERIADIVGPDGARYWVKYTGKEIAGEFDYKVNIEEAIPMDIRTRRNDALELIKTALTTQQGVPNGLDLKYLIESYAKQFGDWLDPQMLFPNAGLGRNPDQAMPFNQYLQKFPGGQSAYPSLGGEFGGQG